MQHFSSPVESDLVIWDSIKPKLATHPTNLFDPLKTLEYEEEPENTVKQKAVKL